MTTIETKYFKINMEVEGMTFIQVGVQEHHQVEDSIMGKEALIHKILTKDMIKHKDLIKIM
jgi:radical SAM superfamily enzyme YgiQ (UPF0313 family)